MKRIVSSVPITKSCAAFLKAQVTEMRRAIQPTNDNVGFWLKPKMSLASSAVGAVRRMRAHIGLLAQPESMRSIVGATQ